MTAGCSAAPMPGAPGPVPSPYVASASGSVPAAAAPAFPSGVTPSRVVISAIGLDEPLIGLGISDTGEMEVPTDYDDVGWFTGGGRPGGIGPTVLAGHVDSESGPAVFDRLDDLVPGDRVTVLDAAGVSAVYRVARVGDYRKDQFPTTEVFGAVARDEIRLITCGGDFDAAVGSYDRNVVVFGVRV